MHDPLGKVQNQIVHDPLSVFHVDLNLALVDLTAFITHQIRNPTQNETSDLVSVGHPGDCARFPVSRHCAVFGLQIWNIFRHEVPVCGYENGSQHGTGIWLAQPRKIDLRRIVSDRFLRIHHLLDNVIDDRPLDQHDGVLFNFPYKPATGAQIHDQIRRPAINHVLR